MPKENNLLEFSHDELGAAGGIYRSDKANPSTPSVVYQTRCCTWSLPHAMAHIVQKSNGSGVLDCTIALLPIITISAYLVMPTHCITSLISESKLIFRRRAVKFEMLATVQISTCTNRIFCIEIFIQIKLSQNRRSASSSISCDRSLGITEAFKHSVKSEPEFSTK